jgi:DNA-binding transcriptional MerR regulator
MKGTGYSIKDLEILSGIKAHTIRIWEKRYNLLVPDRTDTNIRYYNDNDLRRILNVSLLVRNGFKISKVATWDDERIKSSVLEVSVSKTSKNDFVERLLLLMINFDNRGFIRLTDEIISEMGLEEAVPQVFFNLFIRIGTYWQVGSVFPAQEHFVTHIFRQKLMAEIDKLGLPDQSESTILFYLAENELHEVSLLYYAYLARKLNYQVIYLGQSVPFDDLKKMVVQMKIDYVFSAFINSIQKEELESYLNELKNIFGHQKIFITGGQVQHHHPVLPRNVKVVKDFHDFKKYLA